MQEQETEKMISRIQTWLGKREILFWAALAAFVLTIPSLFVGFSGDDYYIQSVMLEVNTDMPGIAKAPFDAFLFVKGDLQATRQLIELGFLPWWTYPNLKLAFWRPFSSLAHWIDFKLFPESAWLMHLHSMAWYVLLGIVITLLYRRFMVPNWVAGFAALLYVADDAHGIAIGWLANRNALMAAVFGFLVLLMHDKWRRDCWKPGPWVAFTCFILALLSGESAIAICAYLFAYAVFIEKGRLTKRFATLLPYGLMVILWRIVYTRLGYGVAGSGFYIDPSQSPGRFAIELVQRVPVLLLGQLAGPNSDLWQLISNFWSNIYFVFAAVCILFIGWVLWPILRRDAVSRFLALGMLLSVLPACGSLPNDRLLFFAGFGGMGLVALFLSTARDRFRSALPFYRFCANGLTWVWICVHLVVSPLLLPLYTLLPASFERSLELAAATVPVHDLSENEKIVIVNVPVELMIGQLPYLQPLRDNLQGFQPRLLSAGLTDIKVNRENEKTLVLQLEDGFFATPWNQFFRDPLLTMEEGYTLRLSGLVITVTALTDDGRPAEVRFEFDEQLEDPSLRWVTWSSHGFVPFTLPDPGETILMKRLPLLWWAR